MAKQHIETNMAQRGPFFSTSVPPNAADSPSMTMPSWNGSELCVPVRCIVFSSGVLKTLHA